MKAKPNLKSHTLSHADRHACSPTQSHIDRLARSHTPSPTDRLARSHTPSHTDTGIQSHAAHSTLLIPVGMGLGCFYAQDPSSALRDHGAASSIPVGMTSCVGIPVGITTARQRQRSLGTLVVAFLLLLATPAFSQSPYLGGIGDGYAMREGKISLLHSTLAPDWARVYPSPVRRGEPIEIVVLDAEDAVEVDLFDIQGKLLAQANLQHVLGEQRITLSTAELAVGCYLLRMVRDENSFTQKLIVWDE